MWKNSCGFISRGWSDFVFSDPRVLTAPGTGTEECSSRFTGKCQVRHASRALSLPDWAPPLRQGEGWAEKGTYLLREVSTTPGSVVSVPKTGQRVWSLQSLLCPWAGRGDDDQTLSLVSSESSRKPCSHSFVTSAPRSPIEHLLCAEHYSGC